MARPNLPQIAQGVWESEPISLGSPKLPLAILTPPSGGSCETPRDADGVYPKNEEHTDPTPPKGTHPWDGDGERPTIGLPLAILGEVTQLHGSPSSQPLDVRRGRFGTFGSERVFVKTIEGPENFAVGNESFGTQVAEKVGEIVGGLQMPEQTPRMENVFALVNFEEGNNNLDENGASSSTQVEATTFVAPRSLNLADVCRRKFEVLMNSGHSEAGFERERDQY